MRLLKTLGALESSWVCSFLLGCTNFEWGRALPHPANEHRLAVLVSPKVPRFKRNTICGGQSCFEINPADFTEVAPGILVLELSSPKHHHQHPKVIVSETPTKWLAVLLVATDTARTRYVAEI